MSTLAKVWDWLRDPIGTAYWREREQMDRELVLTARQQQEAAMRDLVEAAPRFKPQRIAVSPSYAEYAETMLNHPTVGYDSMLAKITAMRSYAGRRGDIANRILDRCEFIPETGCLEWRGPTSGDGRGGYYGRMSLDGQTVAVHRVMFTLVFGYIPGKKHLDHTCRNRACVNPWHLEMVTHKENCKRRDAANKESNHAPDA